MRNGARLPLNGASDPRSDPNEPNIKVITLSWLRLIRWNNLFIILLTQLLVWLCVLRPMQHWSEGPFLLNGLHFTLICLSTILIAAGGYIINDYFDIRIDEINKPGKVILEHQIHRRAAIIFHTVCNVTALLLAAYVAYRGGHYEWLLIQAGCTLLLFFYSTHFKRQFMVGNVVVALLTGLTIITLLVYEPAMRPYYFKTPMLRKGAEIIPNPVWVLGIYTCFAFVLTWMREVVKDMEDHIGDAAEGCVTLPIRWGLLPAARFVQVLSLLAIIPLLIASWKVTGWLSVYTFFGITIPLVLWTLILPRQATTAHYHRMSRWLKIIMVSGVGSLLIYFYQANG